MKIHKIKWFLSITIVWIALFTFHMDLKAYAGTKATTKPGVTTTLDQAKTINKSLRAVKKVEKTLKTDGNKIASHKVYGTSINQYAGDYGYNTLTASGKKVYSAMNKIANSFHQSGKNAFKVYYENNTSGYVTAKANVSAYKIYVKELAKVAFAFEADHPIFYWYDGVSYSLTSTGIVKEIFITVNPAYVSANTRGKVQKEINAGLKPYLTKINTLKAKGASDYKIELAVHDLLISKCSYAFASNGAPEDAAWAHNIYGIFGKKKAVCQGYAKSFQLLMNYAGIESIYAIGYAQGVGHAWNLVKLGDRWYGVDTTWDDVGHDTASYGGSGIIYNYFNLSTSMFSKGHVYDYKSYPEMYKVPNKTTTDTYWYYQYYKLKLSEKDLASKETLKAAIRTAIGKIDSTGQYRMRLAIPATYKDTFTKLYKKYYGNIAKSLSSNGKVYTLGKNPVYTRKASDLGTYVFVYINLSVTEVSGIRNNTTFFEAYSFKVSKTDANGKTDITKKVTTKEKNNKLTLSYQGAVLGTYQTTKKSVHVEPIAAYMYTGKAHKPKPVITVDGVTLVAGVDYTLKYANTVKAGTAKITITGIGKYQGNKTIPYKITPATLKGGRIGTIGSKAYLGTKIEPSLTVYSPTGGVVDSSNYTVTYSNNVLAGTATVTVKGKNNYTGILTTTFTIAKRNLASCTVRAIKNQSYTGKAIKPEVTMETKTKKLVKNVDYTLEYFENVNTGRARIVVKGKGNNCTGTKTIYFTIVPGKVKIVTIASKNRAVSMKWKATTGASGYQIMYAKVGGGSYKTLGTTKYTSYKKSGLSRGKTYLFRVRAYKVVNGTKQFGEYSNKVKIKIK